jgi:hypothetical protein
MKGGRAAHKQRGKMMILESKLATSCARERKINILKLCSTEVCTSKLNHPHVQKCSIKIITAPNKL